MKRVWIDGYEANVKQRVGSNQVGFELLRSLWEIDKNDDFTILLPSAPVNDMPQEWEGWKYKLLRPSKLWTWIAVPLAYRMAKNKPDVIFSPTHYIPRVSGVKRVVMIFDLAYLKFPELFLTADIYKLKNWSKYSILNANHIITISESTKKDIIDAYDIDDKKITVAYPGYDDQIFSPVSEEWRIDEVRDKYHIKGKYIIYVGTIQPRKNLLKLMDAIRKIPEVKLVVVGKSTGEGREGWMFEETLAYPSKVGIEDRVIFTGFVDRDEIPLLLAGAECYVLPSLYEGFGMPVVDAMATGVPVIVSNVSSLPEVVGEAGLLVDPTRVDQIEQAIRLVLNDEKKRRTMIKAGLKQVKKYSWIKMADQVMKVLQNV